MKNLIIITALVVFSTTQMSAQAPTKSKADLAWNVLNASRGTTSEISMERFQQLKQQEIANRKYLEGGFKFWNDFPNDLRRLQWFKMVKSLRAPEFWEDIDAGSKAKAASSFYSTAIDWQLLGIWEKRLLNIQTQISKNPNISESTKQSIKLASLGTELVRAKNAIYRGNKKEFIVKIKNLFENGALNAGEKYSENITRYGEQLFLSMDSYGLNLDDMESFTKSLTVEKYPGIQKWVNQKQALLKLRDEPFEFKYTTLEGKEIDLAKLREKVVLLDFWSTGCSECIARMPAIKKVYDKYKDRGFIVISVAINPEIDKEKILSIQCKVGANWPLMMIGGKGDKSGQIAPNSIGRQIWNRYGFSYVPQLLLLDKKGLLQAYNGILFKGDFEPLVKQLLAN